VSAFKDIIDGTNPTCLADVNNSFLLLANLKGLTAGGKGDNDHVEQCPAGSGGNGTGCLA
jgi:hypothetical protein